MWKGAKTGLERGQERVWKGVKTGFKKNGIKTESRQIRQFGTAWNGRSSLFHIFPAFFRRSTLFLSVFDDFTKHGKKGRQKMEERERKEKRSFQFLSRSRFFPFLSRHISNQHYYGQGPTYEAMAFLLNSGHFKSKFLAISLNVPCLHCACMEGNLLLSTLQLSA